MGAVAEFSKLLGGNRAGEGGVAMSVCSAHPLVLRAMFRAARRHETFALVESTSNQVDQYGGYTGMRPKDFARLVHELAAEEGFPRERVLLGGDHLGPNSWRDRPAREAMAEACALVEAYVRAGFKKIHLDASFVCAGEEGPLGDEVVSERCAEMAAVAERACGGEPPLYVVGTEVPTPGGTVGGEELRITTAEDVDRTLATFREAFRRRGLEGAWERVVALVVQPGVEFGDGSVHDFRPVPDLARRILAHPGMVYEAHSTDYQTAQGLCRMVKDHFFILKVGPWLTFALREALFLLELAEGELLPAHPSRLRETLARVMREDARYWGRYYTGSSDEVAFKLAFSYSDRSRYYLGREPVAAAVERLYSNLGPRVPDVLLSQYLPLQYRRVRAGELPPVARELAVDRVRDVMELYLEAGEARDPPVTAEVAPEGVPRGPSPALQTQGEAKP
ncbi:MAG TPA: class II D-tagatose-bisphosphate aldolase, non-catalytic subunit [Anaeromyxobacter sp.]|nr:class II D-tagatose-bisphosphate aldolase, non-catalytic subunit [Anaeromyxobacter sp.]